MTHHIRPEAHYPKTSFYSYEQFEPNTPVVGTAIRFDSKSREIIVDLGDFTGIIPESEVCIGNFTYSSFSDIPYQISSIIGKKIRALVKNISDDGTILLSRKDSMMEAWNNISKNIILEAVVTNIVGFGIFIDIGNGIISYINKKDCSSTRYLDINKWFKIKDKILVKIIEKDIVTFRVSCSRKDAYPAIYEDNIINVGDILTVRIGKSPMLKGGYFCEYTPAISGIMDSEEDFEEGEVIAVQVRQIKDVGLKLTHIA